MIITIGRKPFVGTVIDNVTHTYCGALNLEGSQTPFVSELDREETFQKNRHGEWESAPPINRGIYSEYKRGGSDRGNYSPDGRHVSNFIMSKNVQENTFPYIIYKGEKLYSSRIYRKIKDDL